MKIVVEVSRRAEREEVLGVLNQVIEFLEVVEEYGAHLHCVTLGFHDVQVTITDDRPGVF